MITDGVILEDKIIAPGLPLPPNGDLIFRSGQLANKSGCAILDVDPPEGRLQGGACNGAILPRLWEFAGHPTQLQKLGDKNGWSVTLGEVFPARVKEKYRWAGWLNWGNFSDPGYRLVIARLYPEHGPYGIRVTKECFAELNRGTVNYERVTKGRFNNSLRGPALFRPIC
ncbi:hypothetical protein LZT27_22265, partial [Aeromonas veronii]|uniref:hypothetical protein n=1 Tax=Aeromonas veronii TaxID=654 RepID=UPI0023639CBB